MKREGPCSTRVLNSESVSLSHGKPRPPFMPSHHLAPSISWQTPAPVDTMSATGPLASHGLHPPPPSDHPSPKKTLDEMGAPPPPPP